jgi:hypothetical protein
LRRCVERGSDARPAVVGFGLANRRPPTPSQYAPPPPARSLAQRHDLRILDEQIATFVGLESAASEVRVVENLRIPGLLQTERFVEGLLPYLRPPGELDPQWARDTVALRMGRQRRLTDGDLLLHVVLDEATVRRPVGSPDVMVEQVERLVQDGRRDNVIVQVIPFERGPHPGVEGAFNHLSFPSGSLGDVVYVEGLLGNFVLDKGPVVSHYRQVFDDLAERVALSPSASRAWLESVVEDWRSMSRPHRRARGK